MNSTLYEFTAPGNHTIQLFDLDQSNTLSLVIPDIEKNTYGVLDLDPHQTHIIDLGAHVGTFSIWLAKQFPKATIYAIEPLPVNFIHLQHNIQINGCTNIIPLNLAITGDGRDISLACLPQNTGGALPALANKDTIPTKSLTLDLFIETLIPNDQQVSFLKVDVEGAEYEILENFKSWSRIHHLGVEIHKYPQADATTDWRPAVLNFMQFLKTKPITGSLWTPPLELYEM